MRIGQTNRSESYACVGKPRGTRLWTWTLASSHRHQQQVRLAVLTHSQWPSSPRTLMAYPFALTALGSGPSPLLPSPVHAQATPLLKRSLSQDSSSSSLRRPRVIAPLPTSSRLRASQTGKSGGSAGAGGGAGTASGITSSAPPTASGDRGVDAMDRNTVLPSGTVVVVDMADLNSPRGATSDITVIDSAPRAGTGPDSGKRTVVGTSILPMHPTLHYGCVMS